MVVFETERLKVRHLQVSDLNDLHDIAGDPEIMYWLGDGRPLSREQTREWIELSRDNYAQFGLGVWAVEAKGFNKFVGICGLIPPDPENEVKLVYAFRRPYWGLGLASEIASAAIEFGFQQRQLSRIASVIDVGNAISINLAQKVGMTPRTTLVDRNNMPHVYYAIDRENDAGPPMGPSPESGNLGG